jgi:hypothetical protein
VNHDIIRNLGEGLILRRARLEDCEALAAFQGVVHSETDAEGPDEHVAAWVRDLMQRPHPTFSPDDFIVVEDTASGAIVSASCLISQTWSYGGIHFGVGRPELIGTHPDYRKRGLVRSQFEVIHEWSEKRGEMVQAITGIPYFYRQFGYEMTVTLDGSRMGYRPQVPKLKEGETEPFHVRLATEADLPFFARVVDHGARRYPVACVRDEALWRYDLDGRSEKNDMRRIMAVIVAPEGEPVGVLIHTERLWRNRIYVNVYELVQGLSWLAVTPSVVRYLWTTGEQWAAQDPKQEMQAFVFGLGAEHPAYQVSHSLLPHIRPPYAWFLRVPDLPGFLRHVVPVLEQRLARSAVVGHSGELKISFYRDGLLLLFESGRLVEIKPWTPTSGEDGDAFFPDLSFLQLLFGHRSMEELRTSLTDCWTANDGARALMDALFPKQPSNIWPVT